MASTEVLTKTAAPSDEPATARRTAPHRLRDLSGSGLIVAGVVVVLLALPWIGSYWRAHDAGYTLSSDNALIGLRVHDVFSTHPPMVGQPSTAGIYTHRSPPAHPGPIEFYLLAIPMNVFGQDAGSLIGAAIFTLGSVLVALWAVLRRAGPGVALAGAVVFAGIAWAQGPAVLTDILSSNVGGIPLLGLAVLAWAVMDGDIRLLPLAAFFFSFVAQQHLAILALGLGGGLWVVLGAARYAVRWRWDQRASDAGTRERHWTRWRWSAWLARTIDLGERPPERPKPWVIAALVVTVLAWLPVIVEAVAHKGGNALRIATFSGSGNAKLGFVRGAAQALRALGFPPLLLRTNLDGYDLRGPIGPLAALGGLVVVVLLVAAAVHFWRSRASVALLALTTLFLAAVGALNGAQVPDSQESWRINFYRWTFVVSALTWLALGWALVLIIAERRARSSTAASAATLGASRRSWQLGAVGAVAVVSLLACFASGPRGKGDSQLQYKADRQITRAVSAPVAHDHRVLVVGVGGAATLGLAPSLALKLTHAGHQVYVVSSQAGSYGRSRAVGRKPYDAALMVVSAPNPPRSLPGRRLRSIDLDSARRGLIAKLARQARGKQVVLSPNAKAILERNSASPQGGLLLSASAAQIAKHPEQVLAEPAVAKLIRDGYFSSPRFDRGVAAKLAPMPQQTSWGDRYVDVWMLTPAQVRQQFSWIS